MINVTTQILSPTEENLQAAAHALRAGQLVAFPTETVYGLGANALDQSAVQKIFIAKGRPVTNPIIVHVADVSNVKAVVADWPKNAQRLADRFWPGPLTLVLPKHAGLPNDVTAGGPTVGVRMPNHPVALTLLRMAGIPIAAPSANRSTELSPTAAQHVVKSLEGQVEFIIDGGPCPGGIESTVLDLTSDPPRILRPGLITAQQLEQVIGPVETAFRISNEVPLPSPGLMSRHYAPRTPLEIATGDGSDRVRELMAQGLRVGWLTWENALTNPDVVKIQMPTTPTEYASLIYAALHDLDQLNLERIVVATPPDTSEWSAVRDRLQRASTK